MDIFTDDIVVQQHLLNKEKNIQFADIIITSTNDRANIAKCAFVEKEFSNTQIGAFLRIIRTHNKKLSKYIFYIFLSSFYEKYIQSCVSGTVESLLNIKNEYLQNFTIPLPPLKEQEFIAKSLEELFKISKGLKTQ